MHDWLYELCVCSNNTIGALLVSRVCVCVYLGVDVCEACLSLVTFNFDMDARLCIYKNTGKKPLTTPSLAESDQWQLDLFSPACKD